MIFSIRLYLSKTHRNTLSNENMLHSVMQAVNGLNTVEMWKKEHTKEQLQ